MLYIGTSGFSYDDWKGHFYPEKLAKKDMLGYYAERFNTVEVNSTYYTIPLPSAFEGMDRKTPNGFQFVVKAHQEMTHADEPSATAFEGLLDAIRPIRQSGKLGCLLAQYPWSFKPGPESSARLAEFRERVGDLPVVVEFRNREWATDETYRMLHELDFGFCCVDEPHLKGLMPGIAVRTSEVGYVRFHGRNYKQWWTHEQSHERYNYLYTEEELNEWVPKVEQVNSGAEKTYLFFNNHYQGKSAQNAQMFAKMLGIKLPTSPGRQMGLEGL